MKVALETGEIEFGFLYTAAFDGFLHDNIGNHNAVAAELAKYQKIINELIETGKNSYDDFEFTVISDHGMTPLKYTVDLKSQIKTLELKFGNDYVAVYDSTMARFWFFNEHAREKIMKVLASQTDAKVLTQADKQEFGIDFPDNMFGEEILLFDPGIQISPCDMGCNALPGMHGYTPGDKDSCACLLSTGKPPIIPEWIGDFFDIMTS
jgi:predicted AlkP superfamily pyrophosphatase or phosphodiesterase